MNLLLLGVLLTYKERAYRPKVTGAIFFHRIYKSDCLSGVVLVVAVLQNQMR